MIAIILHQEKLHLLERKRERDEYLKTVSLKEKNLRKKISTVYSRASSMPFFYLLFFFLEGKTHATRALVPFLSAPFVHFLFVCFFCLLFSFMLFGSLRNLSLPKCNLLRSFYGTKI